MGEPRTRDNPLGVYSLTPQRIRYLPEEEVAARRREAEVERGARFRELYAMLGLRATVYADGTLEITVGATGETTKGVMPWDGSSSSSIAGYNAGLVSRQVAPSRLVFRARLASDGTLVELRALY